MVLKLPRKNSFSSDRTLLNVAITQKQGADAAPAGDLLLFEIRMLSQHPAVAWASRLARVLFSVARD
jgi:hypothetical protein